MTEIPVVPIERLDLAFKPRPWPFAIERRDEIAAHFAEVKSKKPAIFNGRILMLHEHAVADGVFRGSFFETDYASFLAWHRWEGTDPTVRDCFSQAALRSADGAFLLGVMGSHTAHAGKIYFPSGTPDPSDLAGATVDLDANLWRELKEETGLTASDVEPDPGWVSTFEPAMIAHLKIMRAREDAVALRERILRFLARDPEPELSDIRIVRGPADLDPMMQSFIPSFLKWVWAARL